MENNFDLKVIPNSIEKGGIAKIRLIDKSEEHAAQRMLKVTIDGDVQDLQPKIVNHTGAKEYLWDLDTSQMEKGGYSIALSEEPPSAPPRRGTNPSASMPSLTADLTVYEALDGIFRATNKMADRDDIGVALKPTERERSGELLLWASILRSSEAMSFENYNKFMDYVFCGMTSDGRTGINEREMGGLRQNRDRRFLPFTDTDSYRALKAATEAFVMVNCGFALETAEFDEAATNELMKKREVNLASTPTFQEKWEGYLKQIGENKTIPYLYLIRDKLKDLPLKKRTLDGMLDLLLENAELHREQSELSCFGLLSEKLTMPCFLELIWSYWHEESMMIQGMNAISRRFQNVRNPRGNDPLINMEINPLQPLNNLLWGYIQDEQHRLTVVRRAYEYNHHYGISLEGKAIQNFAPADSRSRFLEAFHQLLYLCAQYYKQEDDLTVKADAFPIRNALREVHMILSEGAHNQYGDLPSTARIEMLMQQFILARPEFRSVLPTRTMVAFPEPWMDRVQALNNMMGWTQTSPIHFANLGIFGERLLLSIRFGGWSLNENTGLQAANWANFWRQSVQEYIHAYHAVTGVDLGATRINNERIDNRPPSFHLAQRAKAQPGGSGNGRAKAGANGQGMSAN